MVRDKITDIVNIIKQPRYFIMCAKNNKILFIPPNSLSMINPKYFDNFFDYVECRENQSVSENIKNVLFLEEFKDRMYQSSIGVKNTVTKAEASGQITNKHVVLVHNQLIQDSSLKVRPKKNKPRIQPVSSIKLSDGSVIVAENNILNKCNHTTTKPINSADSKEYKVGVNVDYSSVTPYVGRKTNKKKFKFFCSKCGCVIKEQ